MSCSNEGTFEIFLGLIEYCSDFTLQEQETEAQGQKFRFFFLLHWGCNKKILIKH